MSKNKEQEPDRLKMAKAKRQHKYEPDYAVAPGETLRDTLESLGMSQKDLAKRTGLTVQTISRILSGEQPVTFETANKLEMVTGIPARMWNRLEMKYREMAKRNERIIAKCINSFGSSDHPCADAENIEGFDTDYIIECLCNALRWESQKTGTKKLLPPI